jgi:hypothetical protein
VQQGGAGTVPDFILLFFEQKLENSRLRCLQSVAPQRFRARLVIIPRRHDASAGIHAMDASQLFR